MVNSINQTLEETFKALYDEWLATEQSLLQKLEALLGSIDGENQFDECRDLAAEMFTHYQEFNTQKLQIAYEDVFLVFSPPWMSSFERILLWVSGFKPLMVFPLVNNSLIGGEFGVSEEQREELRKLEAETRRKEKEIMKAMAKIQESVAAPPLVDLMRRENRLVDGDNSRLDTAMEELKASMISVMENADGLRGLTVVKVAEILNPSQTVRFLAAAARFQLEARRWGLERDERISGTSFT